MLNEIGSAHEFDRTFGYIYLFPPRQSEVWFRLVQLSIHISFYLLVTEEMQCISRKVKCTAENHGTFLI